MPFIWDPSTLARLSAPGFNRAIGRGDVVPYLGKQPVQTVSGAEDATPGPTFDPRSVSGLPSVLPSGGNSVLNNLSALTPILNQIIAQQQQAAIPSGQGTALAPTPATAVPGNSSDSIRAQAVLAGIPVASEQASSAAASPSGAVGVAGDAGPGAAAGVGGIGDAGPGAAGVGIGDPGAAAGVGGIGDAGPGAAGVGIGDPGAAAGPGDAGGGGGGGGGTVICTELRRQGLLDDATWTADEVFGLTVAPETLEGYYLWGRPLARLMARHAVITRLVAPVALRWAKEMAFQVGVRQDGSVVGRWLMAVGVPLCAAVGRMTARHRRQEA